MPVCLCGTKMSHSLLDEGNHGEDQRMWATRTWFTVLCFHINLSFKLCSSRSVRGSVIGPAGMFHSIATWNNHPKLSINFVSRCGMSGQRCDNMGIKLSRSKASEANKRVRSLRQILSIAELASLARSPRCVMRAGHPLYLILWNFRLYPKLHRTPLLSASMIHNIVSLHTTHAACFTKRSFEIRWCHDSMVPWPLCTYLRSPRMLTEASTQTFLSLLLHQNITAEVSTAIEDSCHISFKPETHQGWLSNAPNHWILGGSATQSATTVCRKIVRAQPFRQRLLSSLKFLLTGQCLTVPGFEYWKFTFNTCS